MMDLQEIYNSDIYKPYYCRYFFGYYPNNYQLRYGHGYLSGYGTDSYEPCKYFLRAHSIIYMPRDRSSPSRSLDSAYESPSYSFLSKYGPNCYSLQDYNYHSGASCYRPRGYNYLSGPRTGYEPCGCGRRSCYGSSDDSCGFDPIPIGRSGYAYRRRYSCRPISGDPSYYGCRTYYPPSYWMYQSRYYGPC